MSVDLDQAREWREYARTVFPDLLVEASGDEQRILVAENASGTSCLLVTPVAQARADVEFIRAIVTSTTVGEVRRVPSAWARALEVWVDGDLPFMFGESDQRQDPHELPDETAYSAPEWFGDEYEGMLPLAFMRTVQTCPLTVLARFGEHVPSELVGYDVPAFIDDDAREAVEQELRSEGYTVVHDDALASAYIL